jgi:type I restriction enzyme S subunit
VTGAGWPEVRLGELMASKSRSVNPAHFASEEFELYSIPAYDAGEPAVARGAEIGSTKQVVQAGDVLLSKIIPHIRRVWVVPEGSGRPKVGSSEWIIFRTDRCHAPFLRHLLMTDRVHAEFMRTVSGVGGSLVRARASLVEEIVTPMPPIDEQRRIAEILDRAEELQAKRRESIDLLGAHVEAIFLDTFGDPVRNPRVWSSRPLGEALAQLRYGPRFYNEPYSDDGTRIVRITDLNDSGRLQFDDMPRMRLSEVTVDEHRLIAGDIIFARSGATVGKVGLIRPDDPECIAGAYFMSLRVADCLDPVYTRAMLASASVQRLIAQRSRQSAQQNFSGPGLRGLVVPIPPLDLQRRFADAVRDAEAVTAAYERSQHRLDELFGSLRQSAFDGE